MLLLASTASRIGLKSGVRALQPPPPQPQPKKIKQVLQYEKYHIKTNAQHQLMTNTSSQSSSIMALIANKTN